MSNAYPFVEDTLGKKLEAGTGLSVYCGSCKRPAVLNVAELVKRLGPDRGCLHLESDQGDLLPRVPRRGPGG
jgi:hypothetical protein